MPLEIRKAALTGGSGPVGMALIKRMLEENIEILLFQREKSGKRDHLPKDPRLHVEFYELKELKRYVPSERNFDAFFHLGWANTAPWMRNDIDAQYENVKYSCDAAELAHRLGCRVFVGTGSQAEYGRHDGALGADTLCVPETAYGAMKLCACHTTRIMCRKYGMRHNWARILSGYGFYDNNESVLVSNIENALDGKELAFSKGEQIWDFVYTDDIADALLGMARKGKPDAAYPVGSGAARPLKEYLKIMCRKLGKIDETAFGKVPYSDTQIMHLEADISKLRQDTGWEPKITFEEGIERVIEFYKRRKKT